MSGTITAVDATAAPKRWYRVTPLRRPALAIIARWWALLLVIWSAAGLAYLAFLDDGPVGDADRAGVQWFADRRTGTWNTLSDYGSMISDTLVKVLLVLVVGGLLTALWRRWHDALFLAVALGFEASVFVISSFIVDRDRPPVPHLDDPAPSGSFPSGHVAAAVAFYGGLFLVVSWHTTNRAVRAILAAVAVLAPTIVGLSRVYRGMHHPIDVAAGVILGIASLLVVRAAFQAGVDDLDRSSGDEVEPRLRTLDLTRPRAPAAPTSAAPTPNATGGQP